MGEVGLEPTKPEDATFTVWSNCHYTTLPKEHHYATGRAGKKRLQMRPDYLVNGVSRRRDSNPQYLDYKSSALTIALRRRICRHRDSNPNFLVPRTSASTSWAMSANRGDKSRTCFSS